MHVLIIGSPFVDMEYLDNLSLGLDPQKQPGAAYLTRHGIHTPARVARILKPTCLIDASDDLTL